MVYPNGIPVSSYTRIRSHARWKRPSSATSIRTDALAVFVSRQQHGDRKRPSVLHFLAAAALTRLQSKLADADEVSGRQLAQLLERYSIHPHRDVPSAVLPLEVGHEQLGAGAPHERGDSIAVGELVVVCDRSAALGPSREPDDAAVGEEADVVADGVEWEPERRGHVAWSRSPHRQKATHDLDAVGVPDRV
jgi:hypothetical protein